MIESPVSESSLLAKWLRRLFVIYLGVIVVLSFWQRKLMYFPAKVEAMPASALELPHGKARDVSYETSDGLTLNAWLIKATKPQPGPATNGTSNGDDADNAEHSRLTVLFLHGNGGHRGHRAVWYEVLTRCGCDVLAAEYRGYGENSGVPGEAGLHQDADAAWRFLVEEQKIPPQNIVVMGVSLGGGVAVRLASEKCAAGQPPRGLILVATFESMVETASKHYRWLPVQAILVDRYRSDECIPNVTCPLLQFHGTADPVITFESGQRLHALAPEKSTNGIDRRFVTLQGTAHNDILATAGDVLLRDIGSFLDELRALPAP